jgi:HK97 family phage portal protein
LAWWERRKKQTESPVEERDALSDLLGSNIDPSTITKQQAMTIPSVSACVTMISDAVASLPIKLYKVDEEGNSLEVKDDPRVKLLNVDNGDTLNPYAMKKAMIEDFLIDGAGYAFINKQRNNVQSINYVHNPQVGIMMLDPNPIFKKFEFVVYGTTYQEWQFVKVTRKTIDGVQGTGILRENNKLLSVAYNQIVFEDLMYRKGGQKKGFLKSTSKLSETAMNALKTAFSNLYANNTSDNVIVLNNGLEFQEANNSAVEMQVNQNKIANDEAIFKIFGVPVELLNGKATGGNSLLFESFLKLTILPIVKSFETSLNRDLLLTKEKGIYEFRFDMSQIVRADIKSRFEAYSFAIKDGYMQVDEVRALEGLKPLGLDFIKLGLQDVLYLNDTKQIYTPNTNKLTTIGENGVPEESNDKGNQEEKPPEQESNSSPEKEVDQTENESGNQG